MAWPVASDFQEAVQNPRDSFSDAELQSGVPELDPLGLPRPRAGGFAVVFKMQCGGRNWAIKCFTREFLDQQSRYAAVSNHLGNVRLPYTVGFKFLSNGIRVRGKYYPVLKMEWVEGDNLKDYIERNLKSPARLRDLALRWNQMLAALQAAKVAHGDLQDRNVLVCDGDLRLIDYDGMYVPALAGQESHELGARNYQHPKRTNLDFGPHLDHFASWVVSLSLLALAADRSLWTRFNAGDDCLLLRRKDFEDPDSSPVLGALESLPDESVKIATRLFKSIVFLPPAHVPAFGGSMADTQVTITADPEWWKSSAPQVGKAEIAGEPSEAKPMGVPDISWIVAGAGVKALPKEAFARSMGLERIVLVAGVIAAFILPAGLGPWVAIVCLVVCLLQFHSDPAVARAREAKSRLRATESGATKAKSLLGSKEKERAYRVKKLREIREGLAKSLNNFDNQEAKELAALQNTLNVRMRPYSAKRAQSAEDLATAIKHIQDDTSAKTNAINTGARDLAMRQQKELASSLDAKKKQHVLSFLSRYSIQNASITGIGPTFTARLAAAGFRTAADIDLYSVQRVEGIGYNRATTLVEWRRSWETRAQSGAPSTLSQAERQAIESKYSAQLLRLQGQKNSLDKEKTDSERAARERNRMELEEISRNELEEHKRSAEMADNVRSKCRNERKRVENEQTSIIQKDQEKLVELAESMQEVHKEVFKHTYEMNRDREAVRSFSQLTFFRYLRRIV